MIDAARALREAIEVEIERLHAEEERLRWFASSLDTFIEQPGQDDADVPPSSAGQRPAPVSPPAAGQGPPEPSPSPVTPAPGTVDCPTCGEPVKPQGLGSHQRKHKPGYVPPERASRALATDADGKVQCPDCPARMVPAGIGPHRRARHGVTGGRHVAKADHPSPRNDTSDGQPQVNQWLCGRCPRTFLTEEMRRAHYDATGHGSPEPLPIPPALARRHPDRTVEA
jgi:hypothetical protein